VKFNYEPQRSFNFQVNHGGNPTTIPVDGRPVLDLAVLSVSYDVASPYFESHVSDIEVRYRMFMDFDVAAALKKWLAAESPSLTITLEDVYGKALDKNSYVGVTLYGLRVENLSYDKNDTAVLKADFKGIRDTGRQL
jgi:hypothetical protein